MTKPVVSIIINNYNYAHYLTHAIDSALAQSYPDVEVIVVDDGSTDGSLALLSCYSGRIVALVKTNGGQASAFNVGYAHCRGEIVIFLDADDLLDPTIVERVVKRFEAAPAAVRVQYRLAVVDPAGRRTGSTMPTGIIPAGDLGRETLLYGDDLPWLPTSGNAFSRRVLEQIMPMPEAAYRICADYYLSNLSPLFGPVLAIEETGGCYRVHGANQYQSDQLDLEQIRQRIIRTRVTHRHMHIWAEQLAREEKQRVPLAARSLTVVANRMVSLRLEPDQHPVVEDARMSLMGRGIVAASRRTDLSVALRCMYVCWFVLVAFVPKQGVRWLAMRLFYPDSQQTSRRTLFTYLRKLRFGYGSKA